MCIIGGHEKRIVAPGEGCDSPAVLESRVVKVPQDGFGGRDLHGEIVVRTRPIISGSLVAPGASRIAQIGGVLSVRALKWARYHREYCEPFNKVMTTKNICV